MTSDEQFLHALLQQKEGRHLEFKEARNSYSLDKLYEYVVGIANSGGGNMLFGVTDERQIVGTQAFRDVQDLEHRIHVKLHIQVITREMFVQGNRVLMLIIPQRHKGVPLEVDGKYLLRTGSSLVTMTPHQLKEVFSEGDDTPNLRSVSDPVTGQEVFKRLDVEAYFRLTDTAMPGQLTEQLRGLASTNLLKLLGEDQYVITTVGALFLARDLSHFPSLLWRRLRLIKYDGTGRLHAVVDHYETSGYGIGFERVMNLVRSHVPTPETIGDGRREDRFHYHPTAVREFVANALVHQDLGVNGIQITIEIFDDRIEIKNPGLPLIDVKRFVDESRTRNQELSDVMRRAKLCEARGSGVDRALARIEEALLPAPEFYSENDATTVVLYKERLFEAMNLQERTWAIFLHACLRHVNSEALTNSSLRARFGLPGNKATQVSASIAATVEQKLIKLDPRAGASKKHARYLPFFA